MNTFKTNQYRLRSAFYFLCYQPNRGIDIISNNILLFIVITMLASVGCMSKNMVAPHYNINTPHDDVQIDKFTNIKIHPIINQDLSIINHNYKCRLVGHIEINPNPAKYIYDAFVAEAKQLNIYSDDDKHSALFIITNIELNAGNWNVGEWIITGELMTGGASMASASTVHKFNTGYDAQLACHNALTQFPVAVNNYIYELLESIANKN